MRLTKLACLWLCAFVFAINAYAEDDVNIGGRANVGFEVERFKHGETKYDAEIEIKSKRKSGARGVVSLRTDDENEIFVQDIYIEKKFENSPFELEGGKHKKRLGLEWQYGERNRLTIRRSYIYQKLEEFAYVGRESILRLDYKSPDDSLNYAIALGYSDATDTNLQFSLDAQLGASATRVGTWALLQHDKIDTKRQLVWANVMSIWSHEQPLRYELEAFSGVDPFESEFQKTFGDGKDIYFYGSKFQIGYALFREEKSYLQPFFLGSYYVHNSKVSDYNTLETTVGLNYVVDNIYFKINASVIGTNSEMAPDERVYDDSNLSGEVALYF